MSNKKSAGVDQISILVIKRISEYIIKPLTYIFNKSIESGVYPEYFKKAQIIPIYKSDDNGNY